MRPLQDWLSQSVRFQGYLDRWESQPNTDRYLLKNVRVKRYQDDAEIRNVGHIWLYFAPGAQITNMRERLNLYSGVGIVTGYRRSNGTQDYGIKSIPAFNLCALHECIAGDGPRFSQTKLDAIQEGLTAIEQQFAIFPFNVPYAEIHKVFADSAEYHARNVAINRSYDQMKSQCRGAVRCDPVTFPRRGRVAVKGFGAISNG